MLLKRHHRNFYYHYLCKINGRVILENLDYQNLRNYLKGFEGEYAFFEHIKGFEQLVRIWDLTLDMFGTAQYDFLFIANDTVIHIDIKNYSGLYRFDNGNFISEQGYVHQGLLSQLDRAHRKLEQFIKMNHFQYKVNSRILFVNPEFKLKGYNGNEHIVLFSQMTEVINYLKTLVSHNEDMKLGLLLVEHHVDKDYNRVHFYDYDYIEKGIKCVSCGAIGMFEEKSQRTMQCICGFEIGKKDYIIEAIEDISLFKNGSFTRKELEKYTGVNATTLKRYLHQYCEKIGSFKDATYKIKKE
ncbi:nuclease-related domain-containing protein [Macrococcoides bohemicum]|uniref:nuclease-related domain-containing protein n=1 Tax=Macrococcoides bohemicum TaxID=1903056 RepID=UPI001940010D|nr:nuclease-related domain-containing protein [Macrococcus bohemicus]QRN50859.1 NERD domain-containing protein [Macrococcus bohemicus]